jgi:glycosyltransferase involved in cell wall biosynthesis
MEVANRKILITLPKLTCGGTERTAAELSNFIAARGGRVTILLMYRREIFYELHPGVTLIQPGDTREKVGRIFYIPFLLNFLRSKIKSEKPDVVFALGYIAFTLVATLGLKCGVVISGRSSPSRVRFPGNKLLNMLYEVAHWALRKRVDGIIAQTKVAADAYSVKYQTPIKVIPNFLRTLQEHTIAKKNHIVTVGRCSFEKGQHYLIEAFSKLRAPSWQLVIVGDGPKRTELETQANNLGLGDRVIFAGFQKDVDFYLSQSKIFVFTSIIEGFPNALMEAMATPLACVSFDCEAGPSDLIRDGENGFLVEVGNVDALIGKMMALIKDENLRTTITENASRAKKEYALDEIATRYLVFFDEVALGTLRA